MSLAMSPLPNQANDELLAAHGAAQVAKSEVMKCESALRKARKLAEQRIIHYENLVLELQGQIPLPLEEPHGRG